MNPIQFVSLGPGDPEMLTLKACRVLRQADVILLPAILRSDGTCTSRAYDILQEAALFPLPDNVEWKDESGSFSPQFHGENQEQHQQPATPTTDEGAASYPLLRLYPLPMQADRSAAKAVYERMKTDACHWQREGKRVVIGVEGDISIYASVHYLLDQLSVEGIATGQIEGIPSFIASAAAAGLSLVSGSQRLVVVPGNLQETEMETMLASGHVVVVMKLSQCEAAMKAFMRAHPDHEYHYFENTGSPKARHLTSQATILDVRFPYFSQLIVK